LKGSIQDIAKAFLGNKIALCIKELDLSKCSIQNHHLTQDFYDMIKSKYTTLKVLSLRYNFIDNPAGIELKEALVTNKTITRMPLDYNSIKITVLESIQKLC
jgi:hypothetical protein